MREKRDSAFGVYCFFGIMMVCIIAICILFPQIEYARKRNENTCMANLFGIFVGLFGIVLIYRFLRRIKLRIRYVLSGKGALKLFFVLSFAFFCFQIFMVYNYYFFTDWDVWTIIEAAKAQAQGNTLESWQNYFSVYPNNLLLLWFYSLIIKIFTIIGLGSHAYFGILAIQTMINWMTGVILFQTIRILNKNIELALLAYMIYILLVGISPWVSIPYSDSVALIFPISIFFLYLQISHDNSSRCILLCFLMGLISYVGYCFKPQVLIMTFAIWGIYALRIVFDHNCKSTWMKNIFWGIIGFICAILLVNCLKGSIRIELDEDKEYQMPHFLMMGMNPSAMGVWAEEDVEFSAQFDTVDERNSQNFQKTRMRIEEMRASGVFLQIVRKTLTNYNDGTFCWGGEGKFYVEILENRIQPFSSFFRNLYYNREFEGKYYKLWAYFEQCLWIMILFLSVFSVFEKTNRNTGILMLAIVGLTIFETIFEARARYLFIYTPVYIILAVEGFAQLQQIYFKLKRNWYTSEAIKT